MPNRIQRCFQAASTTLLFIAACLYVYVQLIDLETGPMPASPSLETERIASRDPERPIPALRRRP